MSNLAQLSITKFWYHIIFRIYVYFSFSFSVLPNIFQFLHKPTSLPFNFYNLSSLLFHDTPHVLNWNNHLVHAQNQTNSNTVAYVKISLFSCISLHYAMPGKTFSGTLNKKIMVLLPPYEWFLQLDGHQEDNGSGHHDTGRQRNKKARRGRRRTTPINHTTT